MSKLRGKFFSNFMKEKIVSNKLATVFCYQNCSGLLWEKKCSIDREKLLKFEAEGQEIWDH